jgi:hypothetical protein
MKKNSWVVFSFLAGTTFFLSSWVEAEKVTDNEIESVSVQGVGKFGKVIFQSVRPLKFREVPEKGMGLTLFMLGAGLMSTSGHRTNV